jgi:hypothetical protein
VTTLVMCLDCNQHSIEQWRHINVRCHIDVTQLCNDVTLMSHNCITSYKCTMSHWCHTIVQWCHIDVSQLCHDVTFMSHNCAMMSHWCLTIVWRCTKLHSIEQWRHINARHHPSTLKRKFMSHKCKLSHNYIQWEIVYCHTSSLKKTMVSNKSTFKMSHVTWSHTREELCHRIVCNHTSTLKRMWT